MQFGVTFITKLLLFWSPDYDEEEIKVKLSEEEEETANFQRKNW